MKPITLSAVVFFCFLGATVAAQTRTITVDAAEVTSAVTGMRVAFLPDGGCSVQAELSRSAPVVDLLAVRPAPRPARAAVCTAARNAAAAAARLDFAVSDGGTP